MTDSTRLAVQLATCEGAPDPELTAGAPVTARQEAFARKAVDVGNISAAYRAVYDVKRWTPRSVWTRASACAALPQVRARIEQLRQDAAALAIITRERVIHDIVAQLTADVNELVSLRRYACRYCHGEGFEYQWRDEAEFIEATVSMMDANALRAEARARATKPETVRDPKLPSDVGGYGYSRALEPNLACPHCLGDGIAETIIHDTTKLTGGALMLYAGVKETQTGVELKMHDKGKLLERLCAMMGWNKDAMPPGVQVPNAAPALPANVTPDEAAKCYLRLVGGTG